jgi:hypothetical protein
MKLSRKLLIEITILFTKIKIKENMRLYES